MDKILVIEDEKSIRDTLRDLLEFEGYHVLSAVNGKLGYNIIIEHQPDLVLCDVSMPELGGFELLDMINKNFKDTVVPTFLFLTAKVDSEDVIRGMGLGADDYILKPFSNDHVLKTIRLRLDKRKKLVELTSLDRLVELNDELFSDGNVLYNAGKVTYNSGLRQIKDQLVNEFKTIIHTLPICIHEIDICGKVAMMNPAGLDMLNLTDESDVVGNDYIIYVHDCDKERVDLLLENAISGHSTTFTFKSPSGKYFSSCFVPVLKGGNVEKIIGYSSDITEYK